MNVALTDIVRIGPLDSSGEPKAGVSGEFAISGTAIVSRGKSIIY